MWAQNRAQQNSHLRLWERNVEVSIIVDERSRWRGIIFSPWALSHLNGINYFSMMILKARFPSFQCLPNSSTWKVQLHFRLGMWPHPNGFLFCLTSDDGPPPSLLPGFNFWSHSPLFCSCPRFSQSLCPGISFSALSHLFVLRLPTSGPPDGTIKQLIYYI